MSKTFVQMQTQTQKHKRKLSNEFNTLSSGKSPKRCRFSSLFGLNFFEYEQSRDDLTWSYRAPKAPATCTVSLETAGVLEAVTNLHVLQPSSSSISPAKESLSSSPLTAPTAPPSPTSPPTPAAARFRCSPSSPQSLFKGHHARARSFAIIQEEQVFSNLRKRGDVKLIATVRRTLVANANAIGADAQDVMLARRLSGYLDQWGWREHSVIITEDDSVFEMDVDQDEGVMDVDDQKSKTLPAMPSSRLNRDQITALALDQLVATLTLKHRDRLSTGARSKERSASEREPVVATRSTPKRSSGLRVEVI
ncbi:hypothetical protein V5O48_001981 [Marasmius crinis-equi]|uniref:Uncharacterized protein n=1 Tax=Marasmius crinis-equi TaxID=585013 RepID=A0ABR3FWY7_9AGAR